MAIVNALSKYGNFTTLDHYISSEQLVTGFNFANCPYESKLIDFQPIEEYGNNIPVQPYQNMTDLQTQIFDKYDGYAIPFICIGGKLYQTGMGPSFQIDAFSKHTFNEIQYQLNKRNGTFYNQIMAEGTIISELINDSLHKNISNIFNNPLELIISYGHSKIDYIDLYEVIILSSVVVLDSAPVLLMFKSNMKKKTK